MIKIINNDIKFKLNHDLWSQIEPHITEIENVMKNGLLPLTTCSDKGTKLIEIAN